MSQIDTAALARADVFRAASRRTERRHGASRAGTGITLYRDAVIYSVAARTQEIRADHPNDAAAARLAVLIHRARRLYA